MTSRLIIGLIFIILGLSALTGFDLGRYFFPVLLIALGLLVITGRNNRFNMMNSRESEQDVLNETYVFSGTQRKVISGNFSGGKLVAVFGGADLDLTEVKAKQKDLKMELVAVFGGVQLRIPDNWYVTSEAVGILGGIDNKTRTKKKDVVLHINGAAVFGGIEIKN